MYICLPWDGTHYPNINFMRNVLVYPNFTAAEVFLETPTSLNVTGGTVAEFTCTSAKASSFIWTVNGSELSSEVIRHRGIRSSFFLEPGAKGTRLFIPTLRATSNTTVVCIVIVFNSTTLTVHKSTILLLVQGKINVLCTLYRPAVMPPPPPPFVTYFQEKKEGA